MYGLTECKRCTYLPPAELRRRPGSVGIAIPNTEAYVVDDAGERVAPGVVGELVIRGPHVMQGYWQDEAATDAGAEARPATRGRKCSTPAISFAPTRTAFSISSAARTTSSSRAARR